LSFEQGIALLDEVLMDVVLRQVGFCFFADFGGQVFGLVFKLF